MVVVVGVVAEEVVGGAEGGDADAPGRAVADVLDLSSGDDERVRTAPPHEASSTASAAQATMATDMRARRVARRAGCTGRGYAGDVTVCSRPRAARRAAGPLAGGMAAGRSLPAPPFQRLPSSAAGDPGWTRSRPPPRLRRCADLASPPAAERPLAAYLQLNSIPDAQGDCQPRLVAELSLDLAAAHALIGSGTATAQLIQVIVPTQYAHWVIPGVCDNSIGYYEVPNARVVYRVGAAERSFGIASMISWRGQWYVVHLGAVVRTTPPQGMVDAPATGPGTSAYSSTC